MAKIKKELNCSWRSDGSERCAKLTSKVAALDAPALRRILKTFDKRFGVEYSARSLTQTQLGGLLMQALLGGIVADAALGD
jgi:hypothetical protein